MKRPNEQLLGVIVKQDQSQVVVKYADETGKLREHTINRSEIAEIIETVSPARLLALDPKDPQAYRDYAEELSAKQRDLEARETAMRLYAIAFALDRDRLGKSALRGMIALARSPQEELRFFAALFMLDPRLQLDEVPTSKNAGDIKKDRARLEEALRGVQLLRRGQGATARSIFNKPEVAKVMQSLETLISRNELETACKETALSDRRLRQILVVELAIESQRMKPSENNAVQEIEPAWSRELQTGGNTPVPMIDLDHLTEFDPRQSLYRDGKWITP